MKLRRFALPTAVFGGCLGMALFSPFTQEVVFRALGNRTYHRGHSLGGWVAQLRDPDPERRREAISTLGALGPTAAGAVPELYEVARHDHISVRSWAISQGLGGVGPAAVGPLCELLKDRGVRTVTVVTLGNMGPAARESVPDLVRCLGDESWWTRTMASASLGKIGPEARAAVPALSALLRDPRPGVRWEAAEALKKIDALAAFKAGVR